jgi:flavodoxin
MAIKMRVLCYPEKKKLLAIGNMIKAEYELNVNSVDRIPPAYSCDKERLVILATNLKGSLPDDYRLFVRELTKARAYNVAIIAAGDDACVERTKELIKEAGANVIEDVKRIKMGLFDNKVTDVEKAEILEWVKKTIESLN